MVLVDVGPGLRAALRQIARQPTRGGKLYLFAPFIEARAALWRSAVAIARRGARVILFTRPTADQRLMGAIREFTHAGGRTVFLGDLHAKAFLWLPDSPKERAAFIGSHNFTRSSETSAIELGILIRGEGPTEARIYRALRIVVSGLTALRKFDARDRGCRKTELSRTLAVRKEPICR